MRHPPQRLTGSCSVTQDTLQGVPRGQRQLEPPTLLKGAEPRRGPTCKLAWPRSEPRLQLDTGLATSHLPWLYTSLLICQCLSASLSRRPLERDAWWAPPLHPPSLMGAARGHPQDNYVLVGTPPFTFASKSMAPEDTAAPRSFVDVASLNYERPLRPFHSSSFTVAQRVFSFIIRD